jgi:hypothetical protein
MAGAMARHNNRISLEVVISPAASLDAQYRMKSFSFYEISVTCVLRTQPGARIRRERRQAEGIGLAFAPGGFAPQRRRLPKDSRPRPARCAAWRRPFSACAPWGDHSRRETPVGDGGLSPSSWCKFRGRNPVRMAVFRRMLRHDGFPRCLPRRKRLLLNGYKCTHAKL